MTLSLCFVGYLRSLLSGVEAMDDPGTLIGSTAVIIVVTGVAAYLPARQVTRVLPRDSMGFHYRPA